jgi:hypothetical protein
LSELTYEGAGIGKDLDAGIARIGDNKIILTVDSNIERVVELPISATSTWTSDVVEQRAVVGEFLNSVIGGIGQVIVIKMVECKVGVA